ncbi:hypothetical protein TYRP_002891 [Tyrophagus putrescentiae]|nr:hypothetical protein TYRP_002891 [Tyrophagus putrescentiae]
MVNLTINSRSGHLNELPRDQYFVILLGDYGAGEENLSLWGKVVFSTQRHCKNSQLGSGGDF